MVCACADGVVHKATWRAREVAVKVLKLPERDPSATAAANNLLKKKVEEITKDFVTEIEIGCGEPGRLQTTFLAWLCSHADGAVLQTCTTRTLCGCWASPTRAG